MLAGCAEGKNLFIESVCQNIFSIEELVRYYSIQFAFGFIYNNYRIISCNQLPPYRKRPFVRFLIWVYMNTEDGQQLNQQSSSLTHGK